MNEAPAVDERSPVLAAIDIGSNSFRIETGVFEGERYRRIDYFKQTVRLGAGLDAERRLTEAAVDRGLDCLRQFGERIAHLPPRQVRAVATQTLREARNRNAFLERARQALGHDIEVIAGREEARLIYAGVALLQPSPHSRLVVDIGGRSTEIILGQGERPALAESFALGCVSFAQRFFGDGRLTERAFREAQIAAGAELEEAQQGFRRALWTQALGSSGTAGAVSQIVAAARGGEGTMTPKDLRWCIERCLEAGHIDRLELPSLKADRKPVIAAGLAILYTVMVNFEVDRMDAARGALRHGVLGDLRQRLRAAGEGGEGSASDMRDASVPELQRRFDVDVAQAERVRALALALFDGAPGAAFVDRQLARRELAWAAALHEIGLIVSHHDHHRHAAYLIAKVDAPGFSQDEQARLATLLLGQRGSLKKLDGALGDPALAWQLLGLRLALIGCHAREAVPLEALRLRGEGMRARVQLHADWAARHPRTLYLLQQETEAWRRHGNIALELG